MEAIEFVKEPKHFVITFVDIVGDNSMLYFKVPAVMKDYQTHISLGTAKDSYILVNEKGYIEYNSGKVQNAEITLPLSREIVGRLVEKLRETRGTESFTVTGTQDPGPQAVPSLGEVEEENPTITRGGRKHRTTRRKVRK